jgi:hypothetical protein
VGPLHHPRQPRVEPGQGVNVANLSSLRHNEQLVPEHVQVEHRLGAPLDFRPTNIRLAW